ncbi:MAG TPA: aminotransferase class I/II-fold pyridoxal phosphate-dependent enzyme [Terriglobales bacterium]|nr:aminotransferase class I/II-fold pyridoxal phosphate-dependent enzyme [Terriglobales bacterium]
MAVSRRSFLRTGGIGLAAATLPLPALAQKCGEPPRAPRPGGPILLNGNENPYGPLPSVKAVMAGTLETANRYPDFRYEELIGAIAKLHKVKPAQVHVGCGSTEILKMAADEFAAAPARLVVAEPTFEAIVHYAEAEKANIVRVPLRPDHSHDLMGMLKAMGAGPGLFYICNPNNPTASLTARAELDDFLKRVPPNTYVLMDEAYHHFAVGAPGYTSYLDPWVADDRVIVARTFSKVYGMAGLRLGYAVSGEETLKRLNTEELYDNVNCVAARCGTLALGATAEMQAAVERNARDRAAFLAECQRRRIQAIPTYANFAMIYCGSVAREVRASMHAQGIRIGRPFPPMLKWCRISFGTPEEMAQFWMTWDGLKDCLGEIRET